MSNVYLKDPLVVPRKARNKRIYADASGSSNNIANGQTADLSWVLVEDDLITILRDLKVEGQITATEEVIAWVAGAVASSVLANLTAALPLNKSTDSNIELLINAVQFEVNGSGQLQIKSGVLAPASHSHVIIDVTGLQAALGTKLETSLKGSINGLAELDANGFVKNTQLPSYVDDVLEYDLFSNLPVTGETGKIYVITNPSDTDHYNKTYRWSGSQYTIISETLALGETSGTAYRGDRGKIAYDYSQVGHLPLSAGASYPLTGNLFINGTDPYMQWNQSGVGKGAIKWLSAGYMDMYTAGYWNFTGNIITNGNATFEGSVNSNSTDGFVLGGWNALSCQNSNQLLLGSGSWIKVIIPHNTEVTGSVTATGMIYGAGGLRLTGSSGSADIQFYTGSSYTDAYYDAANHYWKTSGGSADMSLTPGLLTVSGSGAFTGSLTLGNSIETTDNNFVGYRITPYNNGNVYIDAKTFSGGSLIFRTGEGTEVGENRTWLTVAAATGNAVFGASLTAGSEIASKSSFVIKNASGTSKWTISLGASDELIFKNASGVTEAIVDQSGNLKAKGEITAYATI